MQNASSHNSTQELSTENFAIQSPSTDRVTEDAGDGLRSFSFRTTSPVNIEPADYLMLLANFYRASNLGRNPSNSAQLPGPQSSLPLFIIVEIFELAGVVPQVEVAHSRPLLRARSCNRLYHHLHLRPLRYFAPRCVRILVESKDQGWSSYPEHHGTRHGSCTFGELSVAVYRTTTSDGDGRQQYALVRDGPRHRAFTNIHAGQAFETITTELGPDSELVRELQQQLESSSPSSISGGQVEQAVRQTEGAGYLEQAAARGDTEHCFVALQLWARSQYPGWAISINSAQLGVQWGLAGDWERFVTAPRRTPYE